MLETDGPYGGGSCASKNHSHHHGLEDSVYRQTQLQNAFYNEMRKLNVPKNMDSSNTFVLGKGSNIAFSDNEYSGFVLKPNFDFINTVNDENLLEVGAGTYLPDLSRYLKNNKLGGGEFMLGIPGSIGGALTMNAGSYGYEISTNVIEIKCYDLDSREVLIIDKDEIIYYFCLFQFGQL